MSVERSVNVGALKISERGIVFSLGRTEYRHFAMADAESNTVLRATFSVYDIPWTAQSPIRVKPLLQQNATDWMSYLADTRWVAVDLSRKRIQSRYLGFKGPDLLFPEGATAIDAGFGVAGYLYKRDLSTATYVPAGGSGCDLQLTKLAGQNVHYLLSGDGRYAAAVQSTDNIPYGQPALNITIEMFEGCTPRAVHQVVVEVRDSIDAICVHDGEVWYGLRHNDKPHHGAYSVFRYGSVERYDVPAEMEWGFSRARHGFDCATKQFYWLQGSDGQAAPLEQPVEISIHRYNPTTATHSITSVTLVPEP